MYGFVARGDSGRGKCLNIVESIITLRPVIHFFLSNSAEFLAHSLVSGLSGRLMRRRSTNTANVPSKI